MLLQERATHGNLQILLQNKRFEPSTEVLIGIFLQILDAMIYIGSQDVVLSNLCCSNVLVFRMEPINSSANLVKLTNFSMACRKNSSYADNIQTAISVRYCAPEILKSTDQSNYSEASDVYSFGVLMWEACSQGKVPYGRDTSDDNIRQRRLNDEQLSPPNSCNNQLWTIIGFCLYRTPEMCDTMEQIQSKLLEIPKELYPPKSPPGISEPILLVQCKNCHKEFPWNQLDIHERSCLPPVPVRKRPSDEPSIWERLCSCLSWFHKSK
ncbi:unnamed protein product [Rotaria sp. Silwood2]|nr:unnamed protein product [Rotaria sp. Silwood2]